MTLNLNPVMSIIANVPAAIASTVCLSIPRGSFKDVVFFRSRPLAWFVDWQTSPQRAQRCSRKLCWVECLNNPSIKLQVDGQRLFWVPKRSTKLPSSLFFLEVTGWRTCSGQYPYDVSVELLVHSGILDR